MTDGAKRLHVLVFANEKGGTGKSTTAVHAAIALAAKGARVACFDLDHRQRTMGRYLDNRLATVKRTGRDLPTPVYETHDGESMDFFSETLEHLGADADFLVIDTPGRDDKFARIAVTNADTLVTPMNDSFVDFDLIGHVDPDRFRSVSAFAPIVAPSVVPWGEKALAGYLGEDRDGWRPYDTCALILDGARVRELLVDVGDADPFLHEQLRPELLRAACDAAGIPLTLRIQPGYDHSYYFISSFMAGHVAWHAEQLRT